MAKTIRERFEKPTDCRGTVIRLQARRTNYAKNTATAAAGSGTPVSGRGMGRGAGEDNCHHDDNTVESCAVSKSRSCRRYTDSLYGKQR
jgi:hypothetical protein